MQTTKNYKFKKPELTDSPPDITVMNFNWDTIDEKLFAVIQAWENFKASGGEIGGDIIIPRGKQIKSEANGIVNALIWQGTEGVDSGAVMVGSTLQRTEIVSEVKPTTWYNGTRKNIIDSSDYISSKDANGYTKLPNGIIIQWLYARGSISQGKGVIEGNLPITFPNNYLSIFANVTYIDNDSTYNNLFNCNAKFVNKGYFNVNIKNLESNSGSFANCYVLAIGY